MTILEEVEQIAAGWKNLIFKNAATEELGRQRLAICIPCGHRNKETNRCRVCHCPLVAAVRSPKKKCLKGKW